MTSRRLAALLLALLVGCGPAIDPGNDAGSGGGAATGGGTGGTGGNGGGSTGGGAGGGSTVRRIVSLSVTPASVNLRIGNVSGVTATATFDDASTADVSGTVTWTTTPNTVAEVSVVSVTDNLARVTALAVGTAQLAAASGALTSNAVTVTVTAAPTDGGTGTTNAEVRAVWVTRFAYNTQAEVESIIDKAAASGFNVVYFQIRGNGDAYYQSALVPWAKKLTGVLGRNPGWDPLQVAITRAHAKGIQLHAYWNVFAAWPVPAGCATSGTCSCQPTAGQADSCALPEAAFAGSPEHFLRTNPQVMAVNSNGKSVDTEYYWFSAGDPAVRAHLLAVARELLTNYDVDGLHLDRVRYPGTWSSYDAVSNAAYAALPAPKPTHDDWQRANVTAMVQSLYDAVKQLRPKAVLSASVWGIYKALPGCSTSQGYGQYYQDSIGWMKAGAIDAIDPMIYWDIGTGCTDWSKHLDVFMAGANGRHVVAGMHALDQTVPKPDRIRARIDYARQVGAAGTTVFASTYLNNAPATGGTADTWATFRLPGGPYVADAGPPPITWR